MTVQRSLLEMSAPEAARELSIQRLRTVLIAFVAAIIVIGTVLSTILVYGVFAELGAAVGADLRWKAARGARELASATDVAIALGDPSLIEQSFGEYRHTEDVAAIVAVNAQGAKLAEHGVSNLPLAQLFAGPENTLEENASAVWSWATARIEGQEIGRVAVVISKQRLAAGFQLRERFVLLALGASVAGILASVLFVRKYLAPILRLTQSTLDTLREVNETLEQRVADRTAALRRANDELATSLADLNETQALLVEASRRAGMADVATNVLHNVGNVLNSVNVSSEVILETLRGSATLNLDKMTQLLRDQGDAISDFLARDPKGQKIPAFLLALGEAVGKERARLVSEAEGLRENIDHIKSIISRQQELARARHGMIERVSIHQTLEAVAKMVEPSFDKRGIALVCEPPPEDRLVDLDRHKFVEVMMNLLTNARQAVEDQPGPKRVTLRGHATETSLVIEVTDNGMGIAPEHLGRVFEQGFTTKQKGHGFGLHGSACHMIEMGGSLTAHSKGRGEGATFRVDLPLPEQRPKASEVTTQELRALR